MGALGAGAAACSDDERSSRPTASSGESPVSSRSAAASHPSLGPIVKAFRREPASAGIGKLEPVDLRELWPREAKDFTLWMAENMDDLAVELGLELRGVEREGH